MSDEIKINRPAPAAPRPEHSVPVEAKEEQRSKNSFKLAWLILGLVVVLLVAGAVAFRGKLFGQMGTKQAIPSVKSSAYQAVFLTNGQVYFGKMVGFDKSYLTLQDIYYLQVVQPPLQGQQPADQAQQPAQSQPQISLVKLGNELHGPMDEMHISQSQILFYENLKEDGQVVKAIVQDKSNSTGANTNQ